MSLQCGLMTNIKLTLDYSQRTPHLDVAYIDPSSFKFS